MDNNPSPTHISWEDANTTLSSEPVNIYNNTFKILHDLLQTHNGGRWPILNMDLENKLVKDFKAQTRIETTIIL